MKLSEVFKFEKFKRIGSDVVFINTFDSMRIVEDCDGKATCLDLMFRKEELEDDNWEKA